MANRDITFYPNYLHYQASDPEAFTNMDHSIEPSVSGETYLSSGGETTGGAYDLVDNKRGSTCRFDTNGQTTTVTIDFDLTEQISDIDTVILDNNNFGTADAKIQILKASTVQVISAKSTGQTNLDETYHAFVCDETVVISGAPSNYFAVPTASQNGLMLITITTPVSDSDWQVELQDDSTYTANATLGEVCFSKSHTPAVRPNLIPSEVSRFGYTLGQTRGGQNYGHGSHGQRKFFTLVYDYLTTAQAQSLEKVYNVTKGGQYPMYVDLGEGSNPTIYYCRFVKDSWSKQALTGDVWRVAFELMTEV